VKIRTAQTARQGVELGDVVAHPFSVADFAVICYNEIIALKMEPVSGKTVWIGPTGPVKVQSTIHDPIIILSDADVKKKDFH
jgi:hypothetical protein